MLFYYNSGLIFHRCYYNNDIVLTNNYWEMRGHGWSEARMGEKHASSKETLGLAKRAFVNNQITVYWLT